MNTTQPLKLSVKTFRAAGLEARWTKTRRGAPAILARDPQGRCPHQRTTWWLVTAALWDDAHKLGLREAFNNHTLLGDVFSVGI